MSRYIQKHPAEGLAGRCKGTYNQSVQEPATSEDVASKADSAKLMGAGHG